MRQYFANNSKNVYATFFTPQFTACEQNLGFNLFSTIHTHTRIIARNGDEVSEMTSYKQICNNK